MAAPAAGTLARDAVPARVDVGPRAVARAAAETFRPDLEGLRGVAILLVLVFHAGIPGAGGGFVGVDVFYVLSGFLITGLLLRERAREGRVDLVRFYARRARRILPAAAVVLLATLVASWYLLAPIDLPRVAADGVAVALSVGNIRFALEATDYFAANATPSPLLHYWSLGVEEQFYFVWPALMILAMRARSRVFVGLVVLAVLGLSFGASLALTDVAAPWAFYSLPTRAWQLALGGVLAVTAVGVARLPGSLAAAAGWGGLAAIIAAVVLIDPSVPYPGTAALLPSLGAAAVVLGGARRWSPGALLAVPPLRFLGRISYSLYLVHWPILVLPAASLAFGEELPIEMRLVLAVASVFAATALHILVEQPLHRGRGFTAIPAGRTLAYGLTAIVLTAIVSGGVGVSADRVLAGGGAVDPGGVAGDPGGPVHGPIAGPTDAPTASPSQRPSDAPSRTMRPTEVPGATPTRPPTPTPEPTAEPTVAPPALPPRPQPLPADVRPALATARNDVERLNRDGCAAMYPTIEPPSCVYGDPEGSFTVALVGDSHAAQWFPAVHRLADERGWRLIPLTKVSCRFLDLPMVSTELQRQYTECDEWKPRVIERLRTIRPDLTVVAAARGMHVTQPAHDNPTLQGEAMARLLRDVPGRIAILVDTPQTRVDPNACVSRNLDDVSRCETGPVEAFGWRRGKLEPRAAELLDATLVDMSGFICPRDERCPMVLNGMLVYRDGHHLTATFAASLATAIADRLPLD